MSDIITGSASVTNGPDGEEGDPIQPGPPMTGDQNAGTGTNNQQRGRQEPTAGADRPPPLPAAVAHTGRPSQTPNFCLVCSMATMGPPGSEFIQPCRCGYWVHDQCLIAVALQFEDFNPDTRSLGCKICRRAYNIFPVKSHFVRYGVKFSCVWYQTFCYFGMELFSSFVCDITFIKLSVFVLKGIYGEDEAMRKLSSMTPLKAILLCQLIPFVSVLICNISWELHLLKFLRKCSRLPLVGGVFPWEDRDHEDIYKDARPSVLHKIVGGLLLPVYAAAASSLFVPYVADPFNRFLLGGAAVVLAKGFCKMYYRHQKYVRYCTFSILDSKR